MTTNFQTAFIAAASQLKGTPVRYIIERAEEFEEALNLRDAGTAFQKNLDAIEEERSKPLFEKPQHKGCRCNPAEEGMPKVHAQFYRIGENGEEIPAEGTVTFTKNPVAPNLVPNPSYVAQSRFTTTEQVPVVNAALDLDKLPSGSIVFLPGPFSLGAAVRLEHGWAITGTPRILTSEELFLRHADISIVTMRPSVR